MWTEILAAIVLSLTVVLLFTIRHTRNLRTNGVPRREERWDKLRLTIEIFNVCAGILLLVVTFLTGTYSKDKLPPTWVIIAGAVSVAISATQLISNLIQKLAESRRARDGWTQKIRSFVAQWPLPRVCDVDPYALLGVTESEVASRYAQSGQRPPYVARDVDPELDRALTTSGLALLIGHSKSGKSRTAFEAILRLYPQEWLLIPSDGKALVELFRLEPPLKWGTGQTIVWLDDLQRFLGPNGLTPSLLNALAQDKKHVRLVATLTSKRNDDYLRSPNDADKDSQLVLQRFQQISLTSDLSPEEGHRAQGIYLNEPLEKLAAGLGEHLIAARALTKKYEMGKETHPLGHSLVRAAIDWRRVGILRPIPETALKDLANKYLSFLKLPNIDLTSDSFKASLHWAREPVGLQVALLSKVREDRDGQERHFEPFDFLVDRLDRQAAPIPEQAWETILELSSPFDALEIGRLAYRRKHIDIAKKALKIALLAGDTDVIPPAAFGLGLISQGEDDTAEAERLYRVSVDSKHLDIGAMASINLGKILIDRGELGEAEVLLHSVSNSTRRDIISKASLNLGVIKMQRGELDDAERTFRELSHEQEADTVAIAKLNLGRIYMDRGKFSDAERLFREAELHHEDVAAMAVAGLGTLHLVRGELAEAERLYREIVKSKQKDVSILAANNLGTILLSRGELSEAEQIFRELAASENQGANAMANVHLGIIHFRRDQLPEAEHCFHKAINSKRLDAAALAKANLGELQVVQGNKSEAERLFREAIDSRQIDAVAIATGGLGRLFMERGRFDEAELLFREVSGSRNARTAAMAAVHLGRINGMQGKLTEAESFFRAAINSKQPDAAALATVQLGTLYMVKGEYVEAERLLLEIVRSKHSDAALMAKEILDSIESRRREMAKAERFFLSAIRSQTEGATAMAKAHLGKILRIGGDRQKSPPLP